MTRTQKLAKLSRAITSYRGLRKAEAKVTKQPYMERVVRWQVPPCPSAAASVKRWLERCNVDPEAGLRIVDGFETTDEFHAWMDTLATQKHS